MAWFPCDVGPHVNPTRSVGVYLGDAMDGATSRTRWRVCLRHWAEVEKRLAQFEVDPESLAVSGPDDEWLCLVCLKPVDERTRQLFFTCYPAQNKRKDYWARIHDHCTLQDWVLQPEWGR